jgi:hypothetical protein
MRGVAALVSGGLGKMEPGHATGGTRCKAAPAKKIARVPSQAFRYALDWIFGNAPGSIEATDGRVIMTKSARASLLLGLALAFPLAVASMAWAGGASLDEDEEDDTNAGVSFFGFAKDLDHGGGVADAKVSAEIKNRNASLVTRTDDQGHFKFSGFSKDIDPKDVDITCSKEGLKLQRTLRRQSGGSEAASIEVDCLMVKP